MWVWFTDYSIWILVIAGLLTAFPDYRATIMGLIPALLILAVIKIRSKEVI